MAGVVLYTEREHVRWLGAAVAGNYTYVVPALALADVRYHPKLGTSLGDLGEYAMKVLGE